MTRALSMVPQGSTAHGVAGIDEIPYMSGRSRLESGSGSSRRSRLGRRATRMESAGDNKCRNSMMCLQSHSEWVDGSRCRSKWGGRNTSETAVVAQIARSTNRPMPQPHNARH
jgi:hypothetical protein